MLEQTTSPYFQGVYSRDMLPPLQENMCAIVNSDDSSQPGTHLNVGASRFNEPDGRQGCVLARIVESNQGGRFDSNEYVADSFPSGAVGFKSLCTTILEAFSLLRLPEKPPVGKRTR
ncbi:hypothetical protein TNCV_4488771 [Trichonephila clavipes]|nr:hypothetical protein TNCV_4488771 [Trichonephila clavipes]